MARGLQVVAVGADASPGACEMAFHETASPEPGIADRTCGMANASSGRMLVLLHTGDDGDAAVVLGFLEAAILLLCVPCGWRAWPSFDAWMIS